MSYTDDKLNELIKEEGFVKIKTKLLELEKKQQEETSTTLEKEFIRNMKDISVIIKNELFRARESLDKARELSDQYGVPFTETVSYNIGRQYFPTSFKKYEDNVDKSILHKELDNLKIYIFDDEIEYGWQDSYC
jgi:hypothetical protein